MYVLSIWAIEEFLKMIAWLTLKTQDRHRLQNGVGLHVNSVHIIGLPSLFSYSFGGLKCIETMVRNTGLHCKLVTTEYTNQSK